MENKFVLVLKSRKFWAAVIALIAIFVGLPEGEENAVVEAILTVVTAVSYILSVALEDGLAQRNG